MSLNFVGFINQNTPGLSPAKKQSMLDDLCEFFHYQEKIHDENGEFVTNPQTKLEFANQIIQSQIQSWVNELRKQRAEKSLSFEKLELK